ncbi:flap endonuclease-1 [Candidatus Woesearchaeota archaeon]|nr:flap endonuclease-1 [Candidatus Woesearchaeota archaeon]
MGVAISNLITSKTIKIDDLKNKVLAVDAFNILYQFLTTIRQADGTPLKDSKGNITSHLVGLFSRTTNLLQKGVKLVFVFDGVAPELKGKERERRKEQKIKAQLEYDKAESEGDIDAMKKYAARTTRLTPELVEEAKRLISALGIPVIDAPSEGEAQAAYMAKKGDIYAIISQDYDSLLFGAPLMIKNLTLTGRKKRPNKLSYETIQPEVVSLSETLNKLGLDQDQLIALSMLVGTDYNIGGIKGVGPKNALKLVKQHNKDFETLFKEANWDDFFDIKWGEVFYLIKKIPVTDDYKLNWSEPKKEDLIKLLVEEHDFSNERINKFFDEYEKTKKDRTQKGLGDYF